MPTNEERREVATKLRNVTDEDCDMCFLEEILTDCVGDAYVHYSGCQLDYRLLLNGLADLIEPEPERTCEVTEYNDCGPHAEDCTIVFSCGHETLGYIPNYCPSCGAKVIN